MNTSIPLDSRPVRSLMLAVILAGGLTTVLDGSIVVRSLTAMRESLCLSATGQSWVQSAYTLAIGSLLMLGTRVLNFLGSGRMFTGGLMLFSLASVAVELAVSPTWQAAAHALRAAGAAMLAPALLARLATQFPEGLKRTRVLGWYSAVAGIGASVGLVLGSVLAQQGSWGLGLLVNLPLALLLMLGARHYLVRTHRSAGRLDLAAVLAATLGMAVLTYAMVHVVGADCSAMTTIGPLAAGVSSGVLLAAVLLVILGTHVRRPGLAFEAAAPSS